MDSRSVSVEEKDSMSIGTMIQFGDGSYKMGVPELWNGIVDVRDVAMAHIQAGTLRKQAGGTSLSLEKRHFWTLQVY